MKPTFKTTALAILVSLGATACLSNSGNSPAKPTPVQPQNSSDASAITVAIPDDYNYDKASKTSDGTNWRTVNLSNPVPADNSSVSNERFGTTILTSDSLKGGGNLDLNKISDNKLGFHEGTTTLNNNEIEYTVVNQPYSSYGIVTGQLEAPEMRAAETLGGKGVMAFYSGYSSDDINWFGVARGGKKKVTYQGDVMATVTLVKLNERGAYDHTIKKFNNDGKVNVTLDLSKLLNDEKEVDFSGEITSKVLDGKIQLNYDRMTYQDSKIKDGKAIYNSDLEGKFELGFYGKSGFSDIAGGVTIYSNPRSVNGDLGSIDGKKISSYEAVFGGQLQP